MQLPTCSHVHTTYTYDCARTPTSKSLRPNYPLISPSPKKKAPHHICLLEKWLRERLLPTFRGPRYPYHSWRIAFLSHPLFLSSGACSTHTRWSAAPVWSPRVAIALSSQPRILWPLSLSLACSPSKRLFLACTRARAASRKCIIYGRHIYSVYIQYRGGGGGGERRLLSPRRYYTCTRRRYSGKRLVSPRVFARARRNLHENRWRVYVRI